MAILLKAIITTVLFFVAILFLFQMSFHDLIQGLATYFVIDRVFTVFLTIIIGKPSDESVK